MFLVFCSHLHGSCLSHFFITFPGRKASLDRFSQIGLSYISPFRCSSSREFGIFSQNGEMNNSSSWNSEKDIFSNLRNSSLYQRTIIFPFSEAYSDSSSYSSGKLIVFLESAFATSMLSLGLFSSQRFSAISRHFSEVRSMGFLSILSSPFSITTRRVS